MLPEFCPDCAALFDWRFPWAVGIAALAGLVRGFSGFGAALMFVPLCGILYGPTVAVLVLWVIDAFATAPIVHIHLRRATWRELGPLLIGSTILLPFGVWVLAHSDPEPLRWAISGMVLACSKKVRLFSRAASRWWWSSSRGVIAATERRNLRARL